MIRMFFIALIGVFLQFGCASASGPKFTALIEPETNQSIIYVYRPEQFENSGLYPTIHLDNKPTKNLRNSGFIVLKAKPGLHRISTINEGVMKWAVPITPIEFETKPGQQIFISMLTTYSGSMTYYTGVGTQFATTPGDRTGRFIIVPDDIAESELANLNESQ